MTAAESRRVVTPSMALWALEQSVAEKGMGYEYPLHETGWVGFYVRNGEPSCVVACALHKLGATAASLSQFENVPIERIPFVGDLYLEEEARAILAAAQQAQDSGDTWGDALEEATETFEGEDSDD